MVRGCGLVLLAGLAAACGGRGASEDFGSTASRDRDRPEPAGQGSGDPPPPNGISDGVAVPGPISGVGGGDPVTEDPGVPQPPSGEACSLDLGGERIAVHTRDDAAGGCVDLILIRENDGGLVPAELALPAGWGLGHLSAYPCSEQREVVVDEDAEPITRVTGSIGMSGGDGAPMSLKLELTVLAPVVPGSKQAIPISLSEVIEVAPVCDDTALWARQRLNLRASPYSFEGCTQIGGYDRVMLQQSDRFQGTCTRITLVNDYEAAASPELTLPEGWAVEDLSAYRCTPDGMPLDDVGATSYSRATGSIDFGGAIGGIPVYVWPRVRLSEPLGDGLLAPDQIVPDHDFSSDDFISVAGGCAAPSF
jgi:hypothetical protein